MTTIVAALALFTTISSAPRVQGVAPIARQENLAPGQSSDPAAGIIRQRVKQGQRVRVTDDSGQEWEGRIETFAPSALVLRSKDRQQHDVAYGAIVRIDRPHDSLANGAAIGLMSGAVFGLLSLVAEETSECQTNGFWGCGEPTADAYAVIPAITAGIGGAIGVTIDALIRRDPTLFRRGDSHVTLAPSLGRGVRGVTVSVRW